MKLFLAILGIATFVIVVIVLCAIVCIAQAEICSRCPHRKECDLHDGDDNFKPKCYHGYLSFSHHSN